MRLMEIVATICVIITLVGVPIGVARYQDFQVSAGHAPSTRIITLIGVAKDGAWTTDEVDGHNYWRKTFTPATLYLEEGEQVTLRLQSADVHHRFYVPALNIGPIDIEPGHTEHVQFQASSPGTYQYHCTSMCGDSHFYMKGWIVISPKGATSEQPEPIVHRPDLAVQPKEDMLRWGKYLHQKMGCITCHGVDGQGGVENLNYVKKTVPAHNTLAEKLFLEEKEDADAFLKLLLDRVDLDNMEEEPDISMFTLVLRQYKAAKELIEKGQECGKLDAAGPEPPLQMPAWRNILTDYDVEAILAYLITLYTWDEEEEWAEEVL